MVLNRGISRTIFTLIIIPIFLLVDSPIGDTWLNGYGQEISVILVLLGFIVVYKRRTKRVKDIMLIGIAVGLLGEFILSITLGMYHYRFNNIPLWVGLGHSLLYALVFRYSHDPWVRKNNVTISKYLLIFAIVYSSFWLFYDNDWFGFLCTLGFLIVLLTAKKSRLFFLIMYAVVCYMEIVGTATGCWYWPRETFGVQGWIPSGNPPTGIALFYFLFDAAVLWGYLNLLHPSLKKRYLQMKLQKVKTKNLSMS